MSGNRSCSVFIGNLDERVSDRVLYDILIQAGPIVDLYIPRDKETDKRKNFAFAEYETEEIAEYAVGLFSGLVTLYNRTLKFAISGRDKPSSSLPIASTATVGGLVPPSESKETAQHSSSRLSSCRSSAHPVNNSHVPISPGVLNHYNGYGSNYNGNSYDYSRRVFGATLDSITRTRSSRYDGRSPVPYSY